MLKNRPPNSILNRALIGLILLIGIVKKKTRS